MNAVAIPLPTPWRPLDLLTRGTSRTAGVPVLVSLVRLHGRCNERDRFVCDHSAWELLQEVGVSFGWKQRGTTYVPNGFFRHTAATSRMTRHDYRPGEASDPKCVDNLDAIAWAAALSMGHRSPYLSGMLEATHTTDVAYWGEQGVVGHSAAFSLLMRDFTQYAFVGAFAFSHTDRHC